MNGFTIQSVSPEGNYYLVKDWRKHKMMWSKIIKPEHLYSSKAYAMNGLKRLLDIMPEYTFDSFALVKVKNGEVVSYEFIRVKNNGSEWKNNFTVSISEKSNEKKHFHEIMLGDFGTYHYEEFDGNGTVIGGVTKTEADHFILTSNGVNYLIDEELYEKSCFVNA